MSRTPDDRREPSQPKPQQQPKPGDRDRPKPGDWVDALIKQIKERRK